MRTLTSVRSSNQIKASLQVDITPIDQSTTYTFSNWHIQNLTPINYEIDFLGGFGKSSTYDITLSRDDGLTFWKSSFQKLIKARVDLTVNVNSDSFTPHIGIIQNIKRFANDPNLIQLQIFDKFFNNIPQYPIAAIVDSYTGVHPEVSNNNWGYPSYYGKHARPFYMTPVDCDINELIGPINVSSENHVTSLFFNPEMQLGHKVSSAFNDFGDNIKLFFMNNMVWLQQSGSTNLAGGGLGFELRSLNRLDNRTVAFTGTELPMQAPATSVASASLITFYQKGKTTTELARLDANVNNAYLEIRNDNNVDFLNATRIQLHGSTSGVDSLTTHQITIYVKSGGNLTAGFSTPNRTTSTVSFDINLIGSDVEQLIDESGGVLLPVVTTVANSANLKISYQLSADIQARAKSNNYLNYSIFASQVACSDIAISENPIHILTDILNQSSLSFRQSQASDTQLDLANSGFNFQCFFGERQQLADIAQEFGNITGTYIFISDSGEINFRTYQESATVTIDKTITPNDYIEGSLVVRDNPLGTTIFDTAKAKRIIIDYNYNFTTQQYENFLVADPNNTAACNSMAASGINEEFMTQTKYILEAGTTSLYLSNLLRKKTKNEQIIECDLPAQYFELELADVIKLEHPILNNSESLYQITKLNADYLQGVVKITANELINL